MSVVIHNAQGRNEGPVLPPKAVGPIYALADRVAQGHAHILIAAEPGTWADWAARRIHDMSPRAAGPFIRVSRPDLTEAFIEQALFGAPAPGYDATGVRGLRGLFQEALGGTLYFEELSDYSAATQGRILRALREQSAFQTPPAQSVRVIAATGKALDDAPPTPASFGQDLLAHLGAVTVRIAPLRERRSEIIEIAHEFLALSAEAAGKGVRRVSSGAISRLIAYAWPGNLDELKQVIDSAVLVCDGDAVGVEHLPVELQGSGDSEAKEIDGLQETLDSLERTLIQEALRHCGGNQAKAATELGITERLMGLRVKKYGIDPKRFRTRR